MAPESRDELKDMSKNDLVREVLKLRQLLSDQMAAAPGVGDEIVVDGIVSVATNEPLVQCRAGEAAWQWTTPQARLHAHAVLERAIEAERDAATVEFLRDKVGFDEMTISGFIKGMRDHRTHYVTEVRERTA